MQIRVLGCSGSIAAGSRTTSFLLDDDVLIDAGTGVGDLSLDELVRIDHILVSHSHLDHVLAIGLLADSVTRKRTAARRPPVQVHALPATIEALKTHFFNGVIWPDFTRLPSPTVPAVGYAELGSQGAWVFTGDTGPNTALWLRLANLPVAMLVIETAFRNDEHALATISQHLCPSQLKMELAQLTQPTAVFITHIKPGEVANVMTEIGAQGGPHSISVLQSGQVLVLEG